jgi:hypothetical protein
LDVDILTFGNLNVDKRSLSPNRGPEEESGEERVIRFTTGKLHHPEILRNIGERLGLQKVGEKINFGCRVAPSMLISSYDNAVINIFGDFLKRS